MTSARLPSSRCHPITTLTAVILGDYDRRDFALALLSGVAIWPIEEMPHDNTAGCCSAAPQVGDTSAAFRSASLHRGALPGTLIEADWRREGPMFAYVAVAHDRSPHRSVY